MPDWLLGGLLALLVATVTTPAGVSGAVFLLPVQVSLLHVPNPALTPTNLLYNVVATPGALRRFGRRRPTVTPLTRALLLGTLPGVVAGAVARVELFSGPTVFLVVVAVVLGPLGAWLAFGPRPALASAGGLADPPPPVTGRLTAIAFGAGVIGGLYGIGGGSLLGPALAALGFSMAAVAPAALLVTFATSLTGVAAFGLLQLAQGDGTIAPDWGLGLAMGVGGLIGGDLGARLQPRIPEGALRRLLGGLCVVLAARYALQGLGVG